MPVEEYDYEKAMEYLGKMLRIVRDLRDEDKLTVEDTNSYEEGKDFYEDRSGETIE